MRCASPWTGRSRRTRGSLPAGSRGGSSPPNREVCHFSGASYQTADVSLSLRVRAANAGTSHNRNAHLWSLSQGQPRISRVASVKGGPGERAGEPGVPSNAGSARVPPPPLPPGRPAPRSALGCRLPPFPGPTSATPCGCAAPGLPARHPLCRQLPQRQFVSAQFTHKLPHLTPSRPPDTSRGRNPQNPPRPRDPRDSPLEPRWRDSRRPPVPSRG